MQARILLVDDEPSILLSLSAILGGHGYEVETAGSGKEARAKLETQQYQLILTDMRMETETAGYDVLRAAANSNAAVAILTAHPSSCLDWHEQGAQKLLEKPIGPRELLQHMEALLRNNSRRNCRRRAA